MSIPPPRALIADDQVDVIEALRLLLKGEGYEIERASSPAGTLRALERGAFDVVLMDMNYARDTTSGQEGLDLLAQIVALDPTLPVVVMTAWGSIQGAVAALRRGARDYVEKPWDNGRLLATLATQVELGRALRRARRLEDENRALRPEGAPTLIAESPAMQPVLELMERVAPSAANVLVTGEHGTGKEVVASWLHAASPRATHRFVGVNVGGLSEGVFESELFGHVKGAFTDARTDRIGRFELADHGTLFLDEIADVSLPMQAKLLRVLQTGELERVGSSRTLRVDVRAICATNRDIAVEVAEGRFREDLYFRLNTIEIELPPLRERREDIPALAAHYLEKHTTRYGKQLEGFDADATRALLDYAWPGNVRELDHAIERAVLLARERAIAAADLSLRAAPGRAGGGRLEELTLEEAERVLIESALRRASGNVTEAARALGLSRSALYRRLRSHDL
jgi:DNA-binding NtrC family response regulator